MPRKEFSVVVPENVMHLSRIISELKRHSTLTTKGIKNLIVITKGKKIIVII